MSNVTGVSEDVIGADGTWQVVWHIAFYGVAAIGVLVNLYLCIVIPTSRHLNTRVTNYFLWSIAFWHVLESIFVVPWSFKGKFTGSFDPEWAPFLCQVRPTVLDTSFHVEVFSLIMYACWGLYELKRSEEPVDMHWTSKTGLIINALIWVLSIALSLPWGIPRTITTSNGVMKCSAPKSDWFKWYNNIVAFTGAGVMMGTADVLFIILAIKVFKSHPKSKALFFKREIQALILILVVFNLAWLPVWIGFLGGQLFNSSIVSTDYSFVYGLIRGLWHEIVVIFNPFILLILPTYRAAASRSLCCA